MNYKKILGVFIFSSLVIAGCKSQYEELLTSGDSDAKYAAAFDYFNKGKYGKSAQLFESLSMLTQGTERDDTVNFSPSSLQSAHVNFIKRVSNSMVVLIIAV